MDRTMVVPKPSISHIVPPREIYVHLQTSQQIATTQSTHTGPADSQRRDVSLLRNPLRRYNRRHRPPLPPQLHPSHDARHSHSMGRSLLSNCDPAARSSNRRFHLAARHASRVCAARGTDSRQHRSAPDTWRAHDRGTLGSRVTAGAHQTEGFCCAGPNHRPDERGAAVYIF